jgi:hypothetical protein
MKVNLTPPNIQTKLLSKHSGDICKKYLKLGPGFVKTGDEMRCQDDNNTQEPKKKEKKLK